MMRKLSRSGTIILWSLTASVLVSYCLLVCSSAGCLTRANAGSFLCCDSGVTP